jgi:hypothetical protein
MKIQTVLDVIEAGSRTVPPPKSDDARDPCKRYLSKIKRLEADLAQTGQETMRLEQTVADQDAKITRLSRMADDGSHHL